MWAEKEQGHRWDDDREKEVFEEIRVRISGDHDSYPRRCTFSKVSEVEASPGQIMLPGVRVNFSKLSGRTYIRVLGKTGFSSLLKIASIQISDSNCLFRLPQHDIAHIATNAKCARIYTIRELSGTFRPIQYVRYDLDRENAAS